MQPMPEYSEGRKYYSFAKQDSPEFDRIYQTGSCSAGREKTRQLIDESKKLIWQSINNIKKYDEVLQNYRSHLSGTIQPSFNYLFEDETAVLSAPKPRIRKVAASSENGYYKYSDTPYIEAAKTLLNGSYDDGYYEIDPHDMAEMRFWCRQFNLSVPEIISTMHLVGSKKWRDVKNFLEKKKKNGKPAILHTGMPAQAVNGETNGSSLLSKQKALFGDLIND